MMPGFWRQRPFAGYAAPMAGPIPDPVPAEHLEVNRQPDLFDEGGRTDDSARSTGPARPAPPASAKLLDDDLVGRLLDAGPSEIDVLCDEIAARSLSAAVPALEALWRRFHGFGIQNPLREQRAVLETLTRMQGPEEKAALRRIVLSPHLPLPLLPAALCAAAAAGLVLPASFVAGFLDHDNPILRGAAFDLAAAANVPAPRFRDGLTDGVPSIRLAAAIALAHRGDASGRDVLIAALADAPSTAIVETLGMIGDDEAVVALGRCAMHHSDIAPDVIAVLRNLDSPRADRLAARLESERARPVATKAP